jgi:hypothetical protein
VESISNLDVVNNIKRLHSNNIVPVLNYLKKELSFQKCKKKVTTFPNQLCLKLSSKNA